MSIYLAIVMAALHQVLLGSGRFSTGIGYPGFSPPLLFKPANNTIMSSLLVTVMGNDRKILQFGSFKGKSCFEIAHSAACRGLWTTDPHGPGCKYSVNLSHPIYKTLRVAYGLPRERKRQRRAADANEEELSSGE